MEPIRIDAAYLMKHLKNVFCVTDGSKEYVYKLPDGISPSSTNSTGTMNKVLDDIIDLLSTKFRFTHFFYSIEQFKQRIIILVNILPGWRIKKYKVTMFPDTNLDHMVKLFKKLTGPDHNKFFFTDKFEAYVENRRAEEEEYQLKTRSRITEYRAAQEKSVTESKLASLEKELGDTVAKTTALSVELQALRRSMNPPGVPKLLFEVRTPSGSPDPENMLMPPFVGGILRFISGADPSGIEEHEVLCI
jgi:hypothetical protein